MVDQEPKEGEKAILPLASWDDERSTHPLLVYWTRFDNRYQVEVQRIGEGSKTGRKGTLVVFDHPNGDKLLLQEGVNLSYGSPFGPDVQDVSDWQDRVAQFVDEELPNLPDSSR